MASDPALLAELVKHDEETLLLARNSAEKVLAVTKDPTQRHQIEVSIALLNEALDAQEDAGHHDDSMGY